MLRRKKKLCADAKRWVTDKDRESGWAFGENIISTGAGSSAFSAWWYLKYHNKLPEVGGWLSQPLAFLAEIEAVDLVVSTYQYLNEKDSNGKNIADWTKLNATQRAIIQELGQ